MFKYTFYCEPQYCVKGVLLYRKLVAHTTIGGESHAWEKVCKFHDCSSYCKTFTPVSLLNSCICTVRKLVCTISIAKLLCRYTQWSAIRETFLMRSFPRLRYCTYKFTLCSTDTMKYRMKFICYMYIASKHQYNYTAIVCDLN